MLRDETREHLERQGVILPLPTIHQQLDQHQAKTEAVRTQTFMPEKEQAELAALKDVTLAAVRAETARIEETDPTLMALDKEQATLEATARGESDTPLQARIDRFNYRTDAERWAELDRRQEKAQRQMLVAAELPGRLAEVRELDDQAELHAAFEDALLGADPRTIRAVSKLVLRKMDREKQQAPVGSAQRNTWTAARQQMASQLGEWTAAHPSAHERLTEIKAQRADRERRIRRSVEIVLEHEGLRAPRYSGV